MEPSECRVRRSISVNCRPHRYICTIWALATRRDRYRYLTAGRNRHTIGPALSQITLDRRRRRTRQVSQILDRQKPALDLGLAARRARRPSRVSASPALRRLLLVPRGGQLQRNLHLAARDDRLARRLLRRDRQVASSPGRQRHMPFSPRSGRAICSSDASQHGVNIEVLADASDDGGLRVLSR